jgi:hypothetical protein
MLDVVDSDPPLISNAIFKPADRGVMFDMGDITFGCTVGNVASCGSRRPAQPFPGVATVQFFNRKDLRAYLDQDLKLESSDSHPW